MIPICKLLKSSRRVNNGFIINAIAATFMNSSADSVDLLPKALSTINEDLLKSAALYPAPVYSHRIVLAVSTWCALYFPSRSAKCATKMGLNARRGGDSHLGDGPFESDVDDAQDGCVRFFARRVRRSPAAAPQLESPHTTHNTPIMKIYCGHAGK